MKIGINKAVKGREAYIDLYWSALKKFSRYELTTHVPGLPGIFEIYIMDQKKKLVLQRRQKVWYNGIRQALRQIVDPFDAFDHEFAKQIEEKEAYFRFTIIESYKDLLDTFFFLTVSKDPEADFPEHSQRYDRIYLKEHSPNKIVTI